MLRFKLLVSAAPLLIAAFFARAEWASDARPCIASGDGAVELTTVPWQANLRVAFTDNPEAATVRVQVTDNADAADFVMVDDASNAGASGCGMSKSTRLVTITSITTASDPVIYLSTEGPADLRVFVQSRTFTAREAAALLVGARQNRGRLAAL